MSAFVKKLKVGELVEGEYPYNVALIDENSMVIETDVEGNEVEVTAQEHYFKNGWEESTEAEYIENSKDSLLGQSSVPVPEEGKPVEEASEVKMVDGMVVENPETYETSEISGVITVDEDGQIVSSEVTKA